MNFQEMTQMIEQVLGDDASADKLSHEVETKVAENRLYQMVSLELALQAFAYSTRKATEAYPGAVLDAIAQHLAARDQEHAAVYRDGVGALLKKILEYRADILRTESGADDEAVGDPWG